jgi:IPT/TIG domain-containing protein
MPRSTCALIALIFCSLFAITGCGGGGGGSTTTPPPDGSNNPTPSVASVTPSSATAGSAATAVTVSGSGFVSASAIQWNGAALTTTFVSSSSLQANIPANDLVNGTTAKLTVTNPTPGGGTSAALSFTVNNPVPAITSLSPASANVGSPDLSVTVNGSGFVPSTAITWNGAALKTSFVNASQVTTTFPAANLAIAAEVSVMAQNPAPSGGSSSAVKFEITSVGLVIQSIAPRILPPGSPATTITITGSGFIPASVVLWNGSPRPTTYVSASQLKVVLSATDLSIALSGLLSVSNPGAASPTLSDPVELAVSSNPLPKIQSVSVAPGKGFASACVNELAVTLIATNVVTGPTIQANGITLAPGGYTASVPPAVIGFLPSGFVASPGALFFTASTVGSDGVTLTSDPYAYPTTAPAALALCANPSPANAYPASNFSFTIVPSEVNIPGNATVTLGTLPAGVTATASTITVRPTGAPVHLKAAGTTALGSYDLSFKGTAATASATGDFSFTVISSAGASGFSLVPRNFVTELAVPIGSSASLTFDAPAPFGSGSNPILFDVTPSLSALPPGTTVTFTPPTFPVGQSVTVTLAAAANAPVTQNFSITLTGTPSAAVPAATAQFFADVTQPPGSLPDSRTDFVGTEGTPYYAVLDPIHNLIFSSDPDWNRIHVISNATHKVVKTIPVRGPRGIDITQDLKHVWVQTASPQLYEIDTTTLQATHYTLPASNVSSSGLPVAFGVDSLFALSDGTLFISFGDGNGSSASGLGIFNPQTNSFVTTPTSAGAARRSGDGAHVYLTTSNGLLRYDVSSHAVTTVGGTPAYPVVSGVSSDGSRIVLSNSNGAQLYNSSMNLIGNLPGTPLGGISQPQVLFSADDTKIYEITGYDNVVAVVTADASTLKVLGVAPAQTANPEGVSGPTGNANPFAIDSTGIVLGLQNFGISFDDSTFYQTYVTNGPAVNTGGAGLMTFSGPLSGGTVSTLLTVPNLTPDVWFGTTRGMASIAGGLLTFTSPPSTTPGPVNVKFIYPDGVQAFFPQLFEYGVTPEFSVLSGSSPNGGAPGSIVGFGLPQDVSGGTLDIGGNQATITTVAGQYPPFSGDGTESTILTYIFPPGNPGRADVQVTTPNGSGTLPKSIVYAKSVTDYSSSDVFAALLFDARRNQVYLAAGDHVDVFSTSTNQFVAPLHPAAQGATKQFAGMALTPDGSELLVTDVNDGSLAVINPDSPSNTFAVPVFGVANNGNGCPAGPIYVAATSTNLAFVQTGSLPAPSCPPQGTTYIVNLSTRTAAQLTVGQCSSGVGVDASADGNFVVLGGPPCVYSTATGSYSQGAFPEYYGEFGVAISGDGNVLTQGGVLGDQSANILGLIPQPAALYNPNPLIQPVHYLNARLNASGSLYFNPFQNYFEIVDVAHGTLRMRFSLTESVNDGVTPLALDSGGRFVYLATDQGLTVVDFGEALLSIGHVSQTNVSVGSQITVRGSGFDSTVTATVGGVAATVAFTDENTLTLTIPATSSGPQDIVLTRTGAYAESYTLENAVVLP